MAKTHKNFKGSGVIENPLYIMNGGTPPAAIKIHVTLILMNENVRIKNYQRLHYKSNKTSSNELLHQDHTAFKSFLTVS